MSKKIIVLICFSLLMGVFQSQPLYAQSLKLVFMEPNVSNSMGHLTWAIPALKEWRRNPKETVNNGLDGKYTLTVKIVTRHAKLTGTTPRLKICPMPNEPDKCWDQDVLTPVNTDGVFTCSVHFRLTNWGKCVLKFKIGEDIAEVVIDEEKF